MSDSKPGSGTPPTPAASKPGFYFAPDTMKNIPEKTPPTTALTQSDLDLFQKWTQSKNEPWKGPPFKPPAQQQGGAMTLFKPATGPFAAPSKKPGELDAADIQALRDYVQGLPANKVIPPEDKSGEEKPKESKGGTWKFGQAEKASKDGGVKDEALRGISYDGSTGTTTTNPKGTRNQDNDWRGKWKDADIKFVDYSAKSDEKVFGVKQGSFGESDSLLSGKGGVLSGAGSASAKASFGKSGFAADAGIKGDAYLLKGEVATPKDQLLSGKAEGAAARAQAEAKGEAVLKADQATLGGKLSASANLVEGKLSGEIGLTPTRVTKGVVSLSNWIFNTKWEGLDDSWDIGIVLSGEVSGSVGAQAEASGKAGYEKGKATAEAGAKLGLGVGAGVKVGGGVTGLDKLWNKIKWW
ncbi:hypothetical protein [Paracoccus aminophilus]|uniref:Uncharacterized protein n=1 Tax=Paracoccus aminophilus JCM 7686 TaxID=1367847 RepID=S5YV61_PARAH|nr:hypothetical protein [Paracoccus aminophilus]AGT09061.1 hypothetical protein JCM7686_1960 [Paracoccus aminophilus JCM 7686]